RAEPAPGRLPPGTERSRRRDPGGNDRSDRGLPPCARDPGWSTADGRERRGRPDTRLARLRGVPPPARGAARHFAREARMRTAIGLLLLAGVGVGVTGWERAAQLAGAGDFAAAEAEYRALLESESGNPRLDYNLGTVLLL